MDATTLADKYRGVLGLTGALASGAGRQALSGYAGINEILKGHGVDSAVDAINKLQHDDTVPDKSTIGVLKDIAPAYYAASKFISPVTSAVGNAYQGSVDHYADLAGKYLGPAAEGDVGAMGAAAPNAFFPEGRESSAMMDALKNLPEAAELPRSLSTTMGKDSHLAGSVPDESFVYASHDPASGTLQGHAVVVPRHGGMQLIDTHVDPAYQGAGIGTDILKSAAHDAHDAGVPLHSDTAVSPAHMASAQKSGLLMQLNPNVEEGANKYGPALMSTDGRPVFSMPPPTSADEAHVGDPLPGTYVGAYAEGGTVAGGLAGLGKLMAEYAPERLKGLPNKATVSGVGTIDVGPNPVARQAAADYMQQAGIKSPPQLQYVQADPERGARIAAAFEAMPHAPDDPKVKASYNALINETLAQYQAMKKAGVNVEFMPPGQDPYAASPRLMAEDLRANNHMYVYPTDAGFGSDGEDVSGNPLLGQSGEYFGGVPATHNDIFRAVHDYFGHAKEGVGFRANGEENAWQQHARMYSDLARPAMTAETRGQNSWVNFGPHGEYNQTASGADTMYAPQKTGLLPDEFNQVDDPDMHFLHMGNPTQDQVTLDPKFMGRGIKGAEARRGGPKVTALYPWDIDPTQVEQGLESKTPYHVSVPRSQMYDMSADPEGHLANAESFSDAEQAVKDAGYAGYHVPQADGILRGQARLFQPVQASRIGPGAANEAQEDLASGFADGGPVRGFADGGAELAPALDSLGSLMRQYAPEAEHLSQAVADKGGVTYNPMTGDIHSSGYAVPTPTTVERTQVLDHVPDPDEFHQYMMDHQDAFDEDPKAAIHVASDPNGYHIMSVVHHEPDLERAHIYGSLNDSSQFHDIAGNQNIPVTHEPFGISEPPTDAPTPEQIDAYLANPKMARDPMSTSPRQDAIDAPMIQTPWTPGQQTVSGARRNAFPGIYGDPRQIVADATEKVGPEDPLMRRLFGVSRADLSDAALSRQGNELGVLPGAKSNPRGALAALGVMTPQNTQRLVDVLAESRKSPSLFQGMTGWYNMDPLYEHFERIWGDQAPEKYRQFNTLSGMASPGSDVGTEIARGSAANWLHNQGRFDDFVRYGGGVDSPEARSAPADMADLPGHVYHRTAQAIPMSQYLESGSLQMKSPKVPAYIQASGVPATGFQKDLPVGDAHWARGVGLADTRGDATLKGQPVVPGSSVSTPEMQTLHPWWRDQVAAQSGLDSVPAQALAWGAFSPITGVKSAIGAPKLEILSSQIGKLATRLGISPEDARDLVISGKAGAFAEGGEVSTPQP